MKGFKTVRIPESELSIIDDGFRRTGRSTALVHRYISMALLNEGEWIEAVDHFPSRDASRELLYKIYETTNKLNYKGFTFNSGRVTFKYEIDKKTV
jgi:hypothetical protein